MPTRVLDRIIDGTKTVEGKLVAILLALSLSLMAWSPYAISSAFANGENNNATEMPAEETPVQDEGSDSQQNGGDQSTVTTDSSSTDIGTTTSSNTTDTTPGNSSTNTTPAEPSTDTPAPTDDNANNTPAKSDSEPSGNTAPAATDGAGNTANTTDTSANTPAAAAENSNSTSKDAESTDDKTGTEKDASTDEKDASKSGESGFSAEVSIIGWTYDGAFDAAKTLTYSPSAEEYGVEPLLEFYDVNLGITLESAPVDAGTYKVIATWPGTDEHPEKITAECGFNIARKNLTIDAYEKLVYDGKEHTLEVSTENDEGTAEKYNHVSGLVPGETIALGNAVVTGRDAGTYQLPESCKVTVYKASSGGDSPEFSTDNYNISISGTLVIEGSEGLSLTASNGGGVYNGEPYQLNNVSASISGMDSVDVAELVTIQYKYGESDEWTTEVPSATNVEDSLTGISVRATAPNYAPVQIDGLSIDVIKRPVQLNLAVKMDPDPNADDGSAADSPEQTTGTSYSKHFDRMAVEYGVDDAYLESIAPCDLISDAETGAAGSVLAPQAIATKDSIEVTEIYEAGTYNITIAYAENGNYDVHVVPVTIEITKAPQDDFTVSLNIESWTYGEKANEPTSSFFPFVYDYVGDPTYLYKSAEADDSAYTETVPDQAGNYVVKVIWPATDNCDELTATKEFSINKAPLKVTAQDAAKAYRAEDPEFSAVVEGVVGDDTEYDIRQLLAITYTRAAGEDIGRYAITPSGNELANYDVTYVAGELVISQATLTVTANKASKTYGASDPELTVTIDGIVPGDTEESVRDRLKLKVSREEGEAVGHYAITVTGESLSEYEVVYVPGDFAIDKAQLTVTAVSTSKEYGGTEPTLSALISGLKNNDGEEAVRTQLNLAVAREEGEGAGHYAITVTGASEIESYLVTYVAGDFEITKAALEVAAQDASKVYGDAEPAAFTATVTGMKNGDTEEAVREQLALTVSRAAGENVGHYAITPSGADTLANYDVTYKPADFEITKAALSVAAVDGKKVYGAAEPEQSATISGLKNGDTEESVRTQMGLQVTRVSGETVGHYAITPAGAAEIDNYTVSYTRGDFEITKAELTVTAANATKVYGDADPTSFTAALSGLTNGDSENAIRSQLELSIQRTTGESVGTYAIAVSGKAELANYTVAYAPGSFAITKAALAVTADNLVKAFGFDDPELTVTVSGLKNGDAESDVRALLNLNVGREDGEAVGFYTITPYGETELANYTVSYTPGALQIVQAEPGQVAVSVSIQGWTYGEAANTPVTSVAGVNDYADPKIEYKLAEAEDSTYTSAAPTAAGNYTVRASWAATESVAAQSATADFTVERATLTVAVVDAFKPYSTPDPESYTTIISGLKNGDAESTIRPQLDLYYTREPGENVGSYILEVKGVKFLTNYSLDYKSGWLTIGATNVVVSADNKTKVYDENPSTDPELTATISGAPEGTQINYTISRTPGQRVDEYAIVVTLGENPNYVVNTQDGTFSITPRPATITVDNASKVYGDADPAYTGTVAGLVADGDLGEIAYTRESSAVNVGTYPNALNATYRENANYSVTVVPGTLAITAREASIQADDLSKTYDNDPSTDPMLSARVSGAANGDELNYTMAREPGQAAGEYVISVVLGTNPNYTVTTEPGTFTILPKAVTVRAQDASKVYGDADPALTAEVDGVGEGVTIDYTLARESGQNAGEYAISVTPGTNPNYLVVGEGATFTIKPRPATITAASNFKIYGQADPELTAMVSGTLAGDVLNYTLSREEGSDAGDYTVSVTPGENPNYDVSTVDGTFTIRQKDATLIIADATKTYGDSDPEYDVTASGVIDGDDLNYVFARSAGEDVGDYRVTVAEGMNPNYAVAVTPGTLTITKRAAKVTADDTTKVYGEADPALTATLDNAVEGDELDYTLSRATGQDVGTYAISVELGDNPNYDLTAVGGTFVITKAQATVSAIDASKVYGDADPTLGAEIDGAAEGDTIAYKLVREQGESVGDYEISVEAGDNSNYSVSTESAVFSITPKTVTVSAESKSKVYDKDPATDPKLSATVDGAVGDDAIDYTLSREDGQNVGEYAIEVTAGENKNYTVEVQGSTFAITPKAATISAEDATKVYGQTDPGFTATVTGAVSGDTLDYAFTRAEGENVGEYDISAVPGTNPNYQVSVEGAKLSITPKAVTITADALSKVYSQADPALTATVDGAVEGDTLAYTVTRESGEDVGEYKLTVTAGDNPNYEVSTASGTFSIEKKSIAQTDSEGSEGADFADGFTVSGLEEVAYTGKPQLAPVKVVDQATGEAVDVDVAYTGDTTNAGTVQVAIAATDGNYEGAVATSYQIVPATLTVTTPDAAKVYDGTPLSAAGTIAGFVNDETATFTTTGTQTEIGRSQNTYQIVWDGTAQQANYTVVANLGTLEVAPVLYTLTVNYVMSDGSTAPAATVVQHEAGATYSVALPVVAGYNATDDAGNAISSLTGVMPEQNLTLAITYVAVPPAPAPTPADDETPTPAGGDTPTPAGDGGAAGGDATATPADGSAAGAAGAAGDGAESAADEPAPAAVVTIDDEGNPLVEAISDDANALASGEGANTWSLFDVLATALTALLSVAMLFTTLGRKDEEGAAVKSAGRSRALGIASLVPAAGALVALLLTQDFSAPMAAFDNWSVLFGALGLAQVADLVATRVGSPASDSAGPATA